MDNKTLAEALRKFQLQDFGPDDSVIASTLNNPVKAGSNFLQWLEKQVNTASGRADPYDNPNPLAAPSVEDQARAALEVGGFAELGSMPFAPKSAGGDAGHIHWTKGLNLGRKQSRYSVKTTR